MTLQEAIDNIGSMLKHKRGDRSLREVCREIGVSASTLSRVEAGFSTDVNTFDAIAKWLGLRVSIAIKPILTNLLGPGYNYKIQYAPDGTERRRVYYAMGPQRLTEAEARRDALRFSELQY